MMGILTDPYKLAVSKKETLEESINQLNSNTTGLEMYLTELEGKADKSKEKNGSIFNVGNDTFSES
jgi:hypothetical protein